jgi:drug/metabolite transporter (DMT)-like permease
MDVDVRAHISLGSTVLAWAAAFPAIKALLDHGYAAEDVALLRYAIAAPGFALLLVLTGGLPGLGGRDAARLVAAGMLVVGGYHLSLNLGTQYTTAGTAAILVALAPALTALVAAWVGLEVLTRARSAGLAVAFAGIVVVVLLGGGGDVSAGDAKGPLIVLGAPLAFALYNVLLKPLFGRYDLFALTAAASLIGTLGLLPLARQRTVESVADGSGGDLALLAFLGIACTLVGYVTWNIGLRGIGPSRAVAYAYVIPPLGVLLAALTLGEELTPWLGLGGALVVLGVALAQRANLPRRGRLAQPASSPASS